MDYMKHIKKNSKNQKFVFLQKIISDLNVINDLDELKKFVINSFLNLFSVNNGFIVYKDHLSNNFILDNIKGLDNNYAKNILNELKVYIQLVFQNERIKVISKENDFTGQKLGRQDKLKILIPLKYKQKVLFVLYIHNVNHNLFMKIDYEIIEIMIQLASYHLLNLMNFTKLTEKIKLKDILIDISNSIEKVFLLEDVFEMIMKKLTDQLYIIRGMLVLFDKNDFNKLSIFSAYNLTDEEISRGIYKVGEGVIGKVVESGKPISIPDINNDKIFLNRMKIKRPFDTQISFIAVPIKISGEVFGVLAVEKMFESFDKLQDEEAILILIERIIENKVKIFETVSLEKNKLIEENIKLKKVLTKNYGMDNIIGKNKKLENIFDIIRMIADSNSSVLVYGESGTGKELIAKSIHFNSFRSQKPFVSINCAAIPENLLEAELFGYKKGAFTGAVKDKKGKFALAEGGTLFLDEIGEMPYFLQAKLLRVLQEKQIEPIGSEIKYNVDIRIISATNKEPKELIGQGKLRDDLYYRLNVIEIKLPSLKERKDDIPLLVQHFIEKYSLINTRNIASISAEALRFLQLYHWPGNVRELENVIERAVLLAKENTIELIDLPAYIVDETNYNFQMDELFIGKWIENFVNDNDKDSQVNIYEKLFNIVEKELILKALLLHNRNKVKTSEFLGLNRNTLRSKMKQYNIGNI